MKKLSGIWIRLQLQNYSKMKSEQFDMLMNRNICHVGDLSGFQNLIGLNLTNFKTHCKIPVVLFIIII